MRDLTAEEEEVVELLAKATNAFHALPETSVLQRGDLVDFTQAIRAAQNVVFSRPVVERKPR